MFWRLKWDKQTFAKQYIFKRLWLHKTSVTNKIRFPVPHFTLCIVWWGGESINRGEWENVAEILETIYLPSLENCILYIPLYSLLLYSLPPSLENCILSNKKPWTNFWTSSFSSNIFGEFNDSDIKFSF